MLFLSTRYCQTEHSNTVQQTYNRAEYSLSKGTLQLKCVKQYADNNDATKFPVVALNKIPLICAQSLSL